MMFSIDYAKKRYQKRRDQQLNVVREKILEAIDSEKSHICYDLTQESVKKLRECGFTVYFSGPYNYCITGWAS